MFVGVKFLTLFSINAEKLRDAVITHLTAGIASSQRSPDLIRLISHAGINMVTTSLVSTRV